LWSWGGVGWFNDIVFAFFSLVAEVDDQVWESKSEIGFDFLGWLFNGQIFLDTVWVDELRHWGSEGCDGEARGDEDLKLHACVCF
jgi:hypothetical protein